MAASDQSRSWRVSKHSGGNGNCVKVSNDLEAFQDSKDPNGHVLEFGCSAPMAVFIAATHSGGFKHPDANA